MRRDLTAAMTAARLGPIELRPPKYGGGCPALIGVVHTSRPPADAAVDKLFSTLKARHWKELFHKKEEDVDGTGGALRKGPWEVILLAGHVDGEEEDPGYVPDPFAPGYSPTASPPFTGLLVDIQNYCGPAPDTPAG